MGLLLPRPNMSYTKEGIGERQTKSGIGIDLTQIHDIAKMRSIVRGNAWKRKKTSTEVDVFFLVSWQCPIFPGRLQPSIVGDEKLNFCVRDENRWTFSLSSPEMVYLVIAHEILRVN